MIVKSGPLIVDVSLIMSKYNSMLSSFLIRMGIMKKPSEIALWGLDVAEMTSLVKTLKSGKYTPPTASIFPFLETITIGRMTFTATVPSGNEGAQRSMRVYLPEYDGIVFLFDATDSKSFSKSKAELNSLLTDKPISNLKPILILVQRPDPSGIANEEILIQELCLEEQIAKGSGRIALFAYSLSSEQLKGYEEGLISQFLVTAIEPHTDAGFRWLLERLGSLGK